MSRPGPWNWGQENDQRMDAKLTGAEVVDSAVFRALAEREAVRARRYGHSLTVIVFDAVRDDGRRLCEVLAGGDGDLLRETDILGVEDTGHLAVLMPETAEVGAVNVAERIRGLLPGNGISAGIARMDGEATNIELLIRHARTSLARAISGGGGIRSYHVPDRRNIPVLQGRKKSRRHSDKRPGGLPAATGADKSYPALSQDEMKALLGR